MQYRFAQHNKYNNQLKDKKQKYNKNLRLMKYKSKKQVDPKEPEASRTF